MNFIQKRKYVDQLKMFYSSYDDTENKTVGINRVIKKINHWAVKHCVKSYSIERMSIDRKDQWDMNVIAIIRFPSFTERV